MADNVEPEPPPPPDDVVATQPVTPIPATAPPPRQGCMAKRSTLEKVLIILVIIILFICIGFLVAFLIFYFFLAPPEGVCFTEECVKSASRLKSYMDDSVNPCNNFYDYACGGWVKSQTLGPHQSKIGVESIIGNVNRANIRDLLESQASDEQEYKKKPKVFYTACMNIEKLNERGSKPFFELLNSVGKFPALDNSWNETDFRLEDILIKLTRHAIMPLFTIDVSRDLKDSSVNRVYISDASLNLGSSSKYRVGRNNSQVRSYEKWQVDNLVLLGADRQNAEQDIKDIVDFEIKIAKLMRKDSEKANFTSRYNPMTFALFQINYPWLNWTEFVRGVTSSFVGDVFIYEGETVINSEPLYLEKLGALLKDTPKRLLANYILSRLIVFTSVLGSEFVALSDQFNKETLGTEPKPRWERCVAEATSIFPDSVSRMFVDHFFSKDAKEYLTQMIADLRTAFTEILEENKWMTDETKAKANAKLQSMYSKIGYPENIMSDDRLNTLYREIPTHEEQYIESFIAAAKFVIKERFRRLREPKDRSRWPVHAAVVNAQYDPLANEIIFPAAFLQAPVFSSGYPSSMNYGAIGMIIGHEITHGFDNAGSQYDANGELHDWWSKEDKESFKSRAECFVDQYGCYKWDGYSLNGERTLGENIADNGGLKQSYRAYRNLISRKGSEELQLPGLKLNHDQVFFLSFAQVWCSKYRDEVKQEVVETDDHTPSQFRVLGTLQNSEEFATAFQCPVGSRMNPLRKCTLW